jgi:hypothetical protein
VVIGAAALDGSGLGWSDPLADGEASGEGSALDSVGEGDAESLGAGDCAVVSGEGLCDTEGFASGDAEGLAPGVIDGVAPGVSEGLATEGTAVGVLAGEYAQPSSATSSADPERDPAAQLIDAVARMATAAAKDIRRAAQFGAGGPGS